MKSLVLNKAACSFSLSITFPKAQMIHELVVVVLSLHKHTHTGKPETPLELAQNEIKFQGITCFDQRVLFDLSCRNSSPHLAVGCCRLLDCKISFR